jgi:transcriptional regulator with PAS, ATPase and Fis domain
LIEVAHGGTLFLDEIGELSSELQAKLLNVLESRRFRRVGGTEEIEVNLRLIAATNRDLEAHVRSGKFRQDLYYRICVVTCTLPPLRELHEDLPVLANHFRELFNRQFKKSVKTIAPELLALLAEWRWPGNVRELRNVMERAMIFADGDTLLAEHLPPLNAVELSSPSANGHASPNGAGYSMPRGLTLAEVEKEYIRYTLEDLDGDIQRSAESLGISRKSLWERRKRHGLS